jgi:nicotinate-nucleotide pyrophosphorylase (carboxylating)
MATLWMKQSGVVCGRPFFDMVFKEVGCSVEWKVEEGAEYQLGAGERIAAAMVRGPANKLLQGERSALNAMARMSGIATQCFALSEIARGKGWSGRVAGTRKTTPGFRLCEKYAMLVGGCDCHRWDLSSMVMLKDNHLMACGSVPAAVSAARSVAGFSVKIEVECSDWEVAVEAVTSGADVVMLDNLSPSELLRQSAHLRKVQPQAGYLIEASGGITKETIADYMGPHVDVISLGSITQGCPFVDFSLKIVKE